MQGNPVAARIIGAKFFGLLVLITLTVCLLPGAVQAAGLSFLADKTPTDIHPVRANLSVLTYRVPGGLLVADRLAAGQETRFGEAFTPRYPDSEFYLVQGKCHPVEAVAAAAILGDLGYIHWQREEVFVVEIPTTNAAHFAGEDLNRTRIPLDAPPRGWDRRLDEPVVAPQMNTDKDLALIQDFVSNVSQPAFFQTIQEISGHAYFYYDGLKSVSTRFYNTADKDLIGDFLASKLTGYGYTVTFDAFDSSGTPCRNIVATKLGTTYPDEYVVVGGHYDSISPNPTSLAPGAEDNGSGTASVMEIARIAAGREFERTVQFVLFDSEEQGLYGSYHFVQDAANAGRDIIAAITMDMVSYYDTHYAVRIEGETPWEWLMATMEAKVEQHTDIAKQKDYNSWGSDHVPFQQAGIPAFLAIDYDYGSYPGYHQTDDNWSQIVGSAHIGTQITTACAATLAEVAGIVPSGLSAVGDLPSHGRIEMVAYPNPFNPQVMIAFSPDRTVTGELAVYDVTGKRVAVLAQGEFPAGLNRVSWNGQDEAGRAVSSGAYFCRLQAGDQSTAVTVNLVR
jgi:hypothetical protein